MKTRDPLRRCAGDQLQVGPDEYDVRPQDWHLSLWIVIQHGDLPHDKRRLLQCLWERGYRWISKYELREMRGSLTSGG